MTTNNKTNTEAENRYAHCCHDCNGDFKSGLRHCRNYLCSCHHTNTERTVDELKAEFQMFVPEDDGSATDWFENVLLAERQRAEGEVIQAIKKILCDRDGVHTCRVGNVHVTEGEKQRVLEAIATRNNIQV